MGNEGTAEQRLARVRKLLAKAEDPGVTTAESEIYTAKAAELIAAYGIDRALLAESDPDSDVPGDLGLDIEAPYVQEKAALLWAVAAPLRCRGVLRTRYPNGIADRAPTRTMHLFGYGSDLERLELLYTSLLLQLAHGLTREPIPPLEHAAAFRRTWILGFAAAVRARLTEAEDRAAAGSEQAAAAASPQGRPVALVLADRTDTIGRLVREAYPNASPGRRRLLSGGGYGGGYHAGTRADLGGARMGGRSRRAVRRG